MKLKRARKIIKAATIQPGATWANWITLSEEAREFYVRNACDAARERGVGVADPGVVLAEMKSLYSKKLYQSQPVAQVFGMAFALNKN